MIWTGQPQYEVHYGSAVSTTAVVDVCFVPQPLDPECNDGYVQAQPTPASSQPCPYKHVFRDCSVLLSCWRVDESLANLGGESSPVHCPVGARCTWRLAFVSEGGYWQTMIVLSLPLCCRREVVCGHQNLPHNELQKLLVQVVCLETHVLVEAPSTTDHISWWCIIARSSA